MGLCGVCNILSALFADGWGLLYLWEVSYIWDGLFVDGWGRAKKVAFQSRWGGLNFVWRLGLIRN